MTLPQAEKTSAESTTMFAEAAEAATVVARQLRRNQAQVAVIGKRLRTRPPAFATVVGRGSSDHAGVFAKYLMETRTGTVVSSAGLSVNSLYGAGLRVDGSLCLAISQSGRSPDIVSAVAAMRRAGAFVVAMVNIEDSPLARAADEVIPLCAGPETSVAATKSFIAALAAIAQLVAQWSDDTDFMAAVDGLPGQLDRAWHLDWSPAVEGLAGARNMFVLGRGLGYGLTREAALKFKETCSLHAEAYSAAEVLHGPAALIGEGFPVLAFSQDDETRPGMLQTLGKLADRGARVYAAGVDRPDMVGLPTPDSPPALQPILMAQSLYRMVNAVSIARGFDPDRPPFLSKVTETV